MNYYNEFDPGAASWLRELIKAGHIPAGDVDTRSIEDVKPGDLRSYRQCHFFAGIGGWSYALELAGWPADQSVWTGSCPCQPFSAAGKGAGFDDQRHLWPAWFHLIRECRPAAIFGEQVASAAVGPWLDLVQADVEGVGYAFGSVAFPAAGIGAPHIRDRTYWVAYAAGARLQEQRGRRIESARSSENGTPMRVADSVGIGCAQGRKSVAPQERDGIARDSTAIRMGNADSERAGRPGPVKDHWRAADWLGCRDGKWRPVEPGAFPLAHGLPARMVRLRGYGNAIVPAQAAEFICAAEESRLIREAA